MAVAKASAPPTSIRHRYGVTLVVQMLRWALSFLVMSGVVPRRLGPVVYGNYTFLANASATVRNFLDPSMQQAFFTFSSQDENSGPITKLYGIALFCQIVLAFTFIGVAFVFHQLNWFLPGQRLDQILWVTVTEWMMFFFLLLQQLGDCKGLTVPVQIIGAVVTVLSAAVLLAFALARRLTFYSYVGINLFFACVAIGALSYWLFVVNAQTCWNGPAMTHWRSIVRRWWTYASPLILLEYYAPIISFSSVYLIQKWYGSAEQGDYSLALRWSAVAMAFSNAALLIFWRELAHLKSTGNLERAAELYLRFNRMLLFLATTLAFWMSLSCATLVPMVAGRQFQSAIPILMVLAFYPVVQTSGQLSSASFKATERTVLYRNVGLLSSIPELILTYIVLARPRSFMPGYHLGALGVALKLVVYGFLINQVFTWLDFQYFGLNFWRWLVRRTVVTLTIGGIAVVTLSYFGDMAKTWGLPERLSLLLASASYFFSIALLVLARPGIVGLTREDISEYWRILVPKSLAH